MKFVSLIRLVAVCALPLFFVACGGGRTPMFVDYDKVVDSKDFKEVVGDEVKFDFGTGSKEKIISFKESKGSAKIGEHNAYFSSSISGKAYKFTEIDVACGYALLENLVALRDYAKKVGGTKVVNIVSFNESVKYNVISTRIKTTNQDSEDSFLCSVGKRKVYVKLQADIAE